MVTGWYIHCFGKYGYHGAGLASHVMSHLSIAWETGMPWQEEIARPRDEFFLIQGYFVLKPDREVERLLVVHRDTTIELESVASSSVLLSVDELHSHKGL